MTDKELYEDLSSEFGSPMTRQQIAKRFKLSRNNEELSMMEHYKIGRRSYYETLDVAKWWNSKHRVKGAL